MTDWWTNAPTQAQPPSTRELSPTRAARRPPDDTLGTRAKAAPGNANASIAAARALLFLGSPTRVELVCTTPGCLRPRNHSGLHTEELSRLPSTRTTGLDAHALDLVAKLVYQHAAPPPLLHSLAVHMTSYRNEDDAAHRRLVRAFLGNAVPENLPYASFWNAVALMDLQQYSKPAYGLAAKLTAARALAEVATRQEDTVTNAVATGLMDRPA